MGSTSTYKSKCLALVLAGASLLVVADECCAQYQQRRFEPSRPTVSPYLNLFRFNNSVIPNYQSLVRPEQQALRFRNDQQRLDRQQQQSLQQLQQSIHVLQEPPVTTPLVAPTGKGSWFNVQGGSTFGDTSRYFSQVGGGTGAGGGRTAARSR
jgi:hypothetical protein